MKASIVVLFAVLVGLSSTPILAQDVSVARGQAVFEEECSRCHVPVEMQARLNARWLGRPGAELYELIRTTMPAETPGSLSNAQYMDLAAFLMRNAAVPVPDVLGAEALAATIITPAAASEEVADEFQWTAFNGSNASTRYAPLDQITADNVDELQIAWEFAAGAFGPEPESTSVTTPLMVNGMVYVTAGATRNIVALDAASGQIQWLWRPDEGGRFDDAPRKGSGKGLTWYDNNGQETIYTITPGYYLVALDARTGREIESFGKHGWVYLQQGLRLGPGRDDIDIGMSFMPLAVDGVVITGAAHLVGMRPVSASNVKGDIRGFDASTGELLWTFKTIPEPGEAGYESWIAGADFTGNAGVWAPMSADQELGLVYLPVESATGDRYGGDRPGNNLFSSSTVALDYKTGERRWHFQSTHHDVWDWDTPSALFQDPTDGTQGTLHLPSSTGGSNWEGAAYDPETGLLYVPSRTATSVLSLVNEPDVSSVRYIQGGSRTPSVDGIPLVKPPYGRITAIDMNSGDHVWQVVNGDTPAAIKNHPLLQGLDIGRTGKPTRSGLVLTKTLLFAGEGVGGDPVLWAHDKATGDIVAKIGMPGVVTGVPMTYMYVGKQYLVMAVSPRGEAARIVALALP